MAVARASSTPRTAGAAGARGLIELLAIVPACTGRGTGLDAVGTSRPGSPWPRRSWPPRSAGTGLLQQLELKTYDARLRAVATGAGPAPPIALVLIDDHSIRQLEPIVGRWPWPRMVHAVLVDFLARGPATLVVYDVLFSEEAKGTSDIGGTTWTGAESDDALVAVGGQGRQRDPGRRGVERRSRRRHPERAATARRHPVARRRAGR